MKSEFYVLGARDAWSKFAQDIKEEPPAKGAPQMPAAPPPVAQAKTWGGEQPALGKMSAPMKKLFFGG